MIGPLLLAAQMSLGSGPVDVSADSARFEPKERRAVLDGDVRLDREDLSVSGEHAVAEFEPQEQPARKKGRKAQPGPASAAMGQALRRFEVEGRVHVRRGARTAEAGRGVLDNDSRTLLLTGSGDGAPVLRDGSETLSGERILLRLDTEDAEVLRPRVTLRRSVSEEGGPVVPVKVEASRLDLDRSKRLARFSDGVLVRRGETTVRSPHMDARYDDGGDLTDLQLRGGVELRQGERRAVGENAVYDARTRRIVLTGDPKLYDRGDVLAGERIELSLDSQEVRVDRARGRFRPEAHGGETFPREAAPGAQGGAR